MAQVQAKVNAIGTLNSKGEPNKGTLSIYMGGKWPVTLYPNQWQELLTASNVKGILFLCEKGIKDGTLSGEKAEKAGNGRVMLAAFAK